MAYNKDVDYSVLMQQAAESGDYTKAAQFEKLRNEKIQGEGLNYETTSNYADYLHRVPDNFEGSSTGVGVFTADQAAIRDQMNANSVAWWTADDATRAQLAAQNQQLAAALGGDISFDSESGYWSGMADKPDDDDSGKPTFNFTTAAPTFSSDYSARIDEMLDKILNRDSFSYNVEEDPLYQQYREQYNREGDRAMNDTLAAAAATAGGMNSYALSAAQQAQNYYGSQLGDKIPELYQLAYQMYLNDIDNQVRDLGLLTDMDDTQYSRYRDTMSDWRDDRDFAYGMYRDEMGDWQWETNFDYNSGRDTISDNRYTNEVAYDRALSFLNAGVMPDSSVLTAAGITGAEAQRILDSVGGGSTSSSGSTGSTSSTNSNYDYTNGGMSTEEIMAIQRELGVTADGLWGPKTQAAWEAKNGKEKSGPLDDILGDDGEEEEAAEPNWNSALNLGIGPISASFVVELIEAGGVIEDDQGNVAWAPGWSANNYRGKLSQQNSGLFNFVF